MQDSYRKATPYYIVATFRCPYSFKNHDKVTISYYDYYNIKINYFHDQGYELVTTVMCQDVSTKNPYGQLDDEGESEDYTPQYLKGVEFVLILKRR